MANFDVRFWGFFTLGLLSLMLVMGALALWWQTRERARSAQRLPRWQAHPSIHSTSTATASARAKRGQGGQRWLSASPALEQLLERVPGIAGYDRFLQQTGWPISTAQAVLGSLALAVAVLALGALLGAPWALSALAALGAVLLGQATLVWRRQHRASQLELQLPDALSLIARSMQAGHAFSSALQIAAEESPSPMGSELRGVFSEIQYGESANEALGRWAERVAGQDVRIFVIAVRIQSETGGNLAELLHQTAALIRERQKLRGVVRVLSAEGRISAVVLTLLPFVLAALLTALNPTFMSQLWTDPMGQRLLTLALALLAVGTLWMWQLVRMRP